MFFGKKIKNTQVVIKYIFLIKIFLIALLMIYSKNNSNTLRGL